MVDPVTTAAQREVVAEALKVLGVRNLVLAIHDVSFPSAPGEDTGHGSPSSEGGRRFLRFARDLGFTGVQLGPQGETSAHNPSPYDGTIFSRSTVSIALAPLTGDASGALLRPETLAAIVARRPPGPSTRAHHRYAHPAQHRALAEAYAAFRRARDGAAPPPAIRDLAARLEAFRGRHAAWLERDALHGPLCAEHGSGNFRDWTGPPAIDRRLFAPAPGEEAACAARRGELARRYADAIEEYAFRQLLAHEQHAELQGFTAGLGLKLFGDLQIGLSPQDVWSHQALFLRDYLMGAPPSRTNPEGQAWGYAVLDPEQYDGPALAFVRARLSKMFDEFDGVRIDHPHGLVCPWVYRAGAPDPLEAVRGGARLFSSPDLPDHPALARHAIVPPEQLDRSLPRHADGWVASLTPAQVRRYGVVLDAIAAAAAERGRAATDLVVEVLSTLPFPLRAVLEQHGLGRFRVTQKASLDDLADVYRSENAGPADWIMIGTHDTPPVWLLLDRWREAGALDRRAAYLASRIAPSPAEEEATARSLAADPGLLAEASLADLLASRAQNVSVFFADLLGLKEVYNTPGTVSDDNWSLRAPADFDASYRERAARRAALHLPRALALALRARGGAASEDRRALAARLDALPPAPAPP
jgi:4-alpha-glucanotransferase